MVSELWKGSPYLFNRTLISYDTRPIARPADVPRPKNNMCALLHLFSKKDVQTAASNATSAHHHPGCTTLCILCTHRRIRWVNVCVTMPIYHGYATCARNVVYQDVNAVGCHLPKWRPKARRTCARQAAWRGLLLFVHASMLTCVAWTCVSWLASFSRSTSSLLHYDDLCKNGWMSQAKMYVSIVRKTLMDTSCWGQFASAVSTLGPPRTAGHSAAGLIPSQSFSFKRKCTVTSARESLWETLRNSESYFAQAGTFPVPARSLSADGLQADLPVT